MTALDFRRPLGAAPVMFPRAQFTDDALYYSAFRRDCHAFMRAWVSEALKDTDYMTQIEARKYCVRQAEAEMGRYPNHHEYVLLAEAVRDILYIRSSMARGNR